MPESTDTASFKDLKQNSLEFLLLKNLPLAHYHSHFLAATLDFTFFFLNGLLGGLSLFLQLGCFVLDFTFFLISICEARILPSLNIFCYFWFFLYVGTKIYWMTFKYN